MTAGLILVNFTK